MSGDACGQQTSTSHEEKVDLPEFFQQDAVLEWILRKQLDLVPTREELRTFKELVKKHPARFKHQFPEALRIIYKLFEEKASVTHATRHSSTALADFCL